MQKEVINPVLCRILRSRKTFPRLLNRLLASYGSGIRLSVVSQLGKGNEITVTGLDKTSFLLGARGDPNCSEGQGHSEGRKTQLGFY